MCREAFPNNNSTLLLVVFASNNSEKSLFTPVSSPRIPHVPEFYTVFFSPSNDRNFMNGEAITSVIFIYTTGIILKGLRDSDRTSEWASLVKLVHHIVFAPHMAILINSVYVVFIWNCTCTASCTVPTESHRATLVTIVPTSRLVDRAGFISDIVLMNPFVSIISITSITPIIFVFT